MMRKIVIMVIIGMFLLAFGLTIGFAEDKLTFGVLVAGLYDVHTVTEYESAIAECERLGIEHFDFTANFDDSLQISQLNHLLSRGVDAVAIQLVDSNAEGPAIKKLMEAGVKVMIMDTPLGKDIHADGMVIANNIQCSEKIGEKIVKFLIQKYGKPKGKILEIMGKLQYVGHHQRSQGFHNIVDKYPDIEVISKPGEFSADICSAIVEDVFGAQGKEIDAIYCSTDGLHWPGVIPALKRLGYLYPVGNPKHVFLAGIDASPYGLTAIRNGEADYSIAQPPDMYGKLAIQWAYKLLKGENIPSVGSTVESDDRFDLWYPLTITEAPNGDPEIDVNIFSVPDEVSPFDMRLYGVRVLYERELEAKAKE